MDNLKYLEIKMLNELNNKYNYISILDILWNNIGCITGINKLSDNKLISYDLGGHLTLEAGEYLSAHNFYDNIF